MNNFLKWLDFIFLLIIAIVAVVLTSIGVFKVKSFTIDHLQLISTLLTAISLHFVYLAYLHLKSEDKHKELIEKLEISTYSIINSLNGIEVTYFDDIGKVDLYVAKRIQEAKKSVYDLNWQDYLKANPNARNPADKEFSESEIDKSIKSFCSQKGNRIYREIFTFSYPKNFNKMKTHIGYGINYSCSYYDNITKQSKFPKLQFVVIDDEEVIFVSSAYRPNLCSIKDKRIVYIFDHYFDQAWQLSQVIKEKENINQDLIQKINDKYNKLV